jgi:7-cyano-7-deazaguanine tRNA-ribosyltransferase
VDRPVHLFGCGHPVFFSIAALLGCDFFDSASYAKFAEAGRMLLPSGTAHLEQLRELPCECPVCSSTTVEDLKGRSKDEQDLALMKHNLYITAAEMRRVRNAISEGKLFELASARARSHPALYEALQVLMDSYDQIEQMAPVANGSSIFYTGPETARHPALIRFHKNLMDRYPYRETETLIMIPSRGSRPFSDTDPTIINEARKRRPEELILLFITPMGAIPWELEHVHPAQQCLFPDRIDEFTMQSAQKRLQQFIDSVSFKNGIWLSRDAPTDKLLKGINALSSIDRVAKPSEVKERLPEPRNEIKDWIARKMTALLSIQWGITEVSRLNLDSMNFTFSKATGKLRHVSRNGEILFTVIPSTGLRSACS